MVVLFAAPETAWGGIFYAIRSELTQHRCLAAGVFALSDLRGVDVLIPTMTAVTRESLDRSDRLRLIQQCGAGVEMVDVDAARDRGIRVANVPTAVSGSADSVAEMGIYFMIGLLRDVHGIARSIAEGRMGQPLGRALSGKTVGIVGLGGIGRALVKRLRPFNVRILAIKRQGQRKAMEELDLEWAGGPQDLKILLSRSDLVVLSLPLAQETIHLMNRESFSAMKPGAYLINLARGGLVDRDALEEALETGRVAGAGLDVFWEEPPDPGDPLFQYNVLATPHVAAYTDAAMRGVVRVVTENIRRVEQDLAPHFSIA